MAIPVQFLKNMKKGMAAKAAEGSATEERGESKPKERAEGKSGKGDAAPAPGSNFIAGMHMKPGGLHRSLGVPMGVTIPPKRIAAAAKRGGKVGKQGRLAQTLGSLR